MVIQWPTGFLKLIRMNVRMPMQEYEIEKQEKAEDAEIVSEEPVMTEEERKARAEKWATMLRCARVLGLFIVAIALGISVKTQSAPRLTIGFQDYTVTHNPARYDLNEIERQVIAKGPAANKPAGLPIGGSCGQ